MADGVQETRLPHLLEVLKIVEGAVNADRGKVVAYAEQLATKLQQEGQETTAERLRRILGHAKIRELTLTYASTARGRVPVDGESRLSLADEAVFSPSDVKVFLDPRAAESTAEFLRFVRGANRLIENGIGVSPSMLISGPPGCGKTQLGKHVAAELRLPLVTARTDAVISSYLGSTAKNLRLLFDHATSRPCVLFLDEFDAVAKLRDDSHELGELKRVVVSLLQNIDALDGKTVLLAATNHPHLLDPAVWRRFAFKVKMELPGFEVRLALLRAALSESVSPECLTMSARLAGGLSGADVTQAAHDAKRAAILDDSSQEALGLDLLRRLIRLRAPDAFSSEIALSQRLRTVRALDPKSITYRTLSALFGVSLGQVSNLLRR